MNVAPTELIILFLIVFAVIVPFWRIFSRVGHPGWLAIGMVFPPVNLILLLFLAFSEWPIERRGRDSSGVTSRE